MRSQRDREAHLGFYWQHFQPAVASKTIFPFLPPGWRSSQRDCAIIKIRFTFSDSKIAFKQIDCYHHISARRLNKLPYCQSSRLNVDRVVTAPASAPQTGANPRETRTLFISFPPFPLWPQLQWPHTPKTWIQSVGSKSWPVTLSQSSVCFELCA